MKKIMASLALLTTLFACQPKSGTNTTIPSNASGYVLDSSANINTVQKAIVAGSTHDTATSLSLYADTAHVYDNKTKQTLKENMDMAGIFLSKNAVLKVEKIYSIWETVLNKPEADGTQSYVIVNFNASVTRGGKKIDFIINATFAFKDGKITTEWDLYDTAELQELLK